MDTMAASTNKKQLLPNYFGLSFTQSEVDFVVPNLTTDLPLCIDPFLLYKSKDETLRNLHKNLLDIFNQGIQYYREGKEKDLNILIDFPEVNEIGFGYSEGRIRGSGLGSQLNQLLASTLSASEPLQERGLRHIEELQLVAIGVGADRVSDIAANVLKAFLINYTQKQANLWNIPLTSAMPISHYFDFDSWEWADGYFDLPKNPITGDPILLVPRRIVRRLPWINYDDFFSNELKAFLRPSPNKRMPGYPGMPKQEKMQIAKQEVVRLTRGHLALLDQYIKRKEKESSHAGPLLGQDQSFANSEYELGERFITQLDSLPIGHATANDYQRLILKILNYLFEPELTNGELEVKTYLETERRDIIYTNEAETSFWKFVRDTYHSLLVMFENKNVEKVELEHVNQTASYLGVRLGMLGFITTRKPPGDNIMRKTYTIFNDTPGEPRKMILILSDEDIKLMIRLKQKNKNPATYIQSLYRQFRTRVQ
jgi:hypothetical protein